MVMTGPTEKGEKISSFFLGIELAVVRLMLGVTVG